MEYCSRHGIAHSVFLSWSYADQDKALALEVVNRSECNQCGTVTSEWLDGDGEYREPPPYVATSILCGGCEALADKISAIPEKKRNQYHVYLVPNKEVEDGDRRNPSSEDRTTS